MNPSNKEKVLMHLVSTLIILFMIAGTLFAIWVFAGMLPLVGKLVNGTYYMTLAAAIGMLCYCGALFIAVTLLRMVRSLREDPFVMKNVTALRCMGFTAMGITGSTFFLLLIPANAYIFVAAGLAVGLCGLLSLVLAQVFERAIAYKQENDLTI